MTRTTKLTEKQWEEITRRMVEGEKAAALAKEFKINRSAISRRVAQQVEQINSVSNQYVEAETAVISMPISQQLLATKRINNLRAIRDNMASAANYNAASTHRLAAIVNGIVQRIDDSNPLSEVSLDAARSVAAYTKLANEVAVIPRDHLNMTVKGGIPVDDGDDDTIDIPENPIEASRAYQRLMLGND